MPKKTVTTKEQIPKWYTKRIKGFSDLTQQEALFEYEALKVRERARKYAKRQNIEYIPPKIVRPSMVIEPDINFIKRIELPTIQEAVKKQEPIVSPYSGLYDYEREEWKEEHFPDYQAPRYEDYQSGWEDYEGDEEYLESDEPEEEVHASRIIQEFYHPEPSPPVTPTVEKEITEEDVAWVDPDTGEVYTFDDIADMEQSALDFLRSLKVKLEEVATSVVYSHSYYSNGRTKAQSQIRFYNDNVTKAYNKVIAKIDEILSSSDSVKRFAVNNSNEDKLEQIQNAATEYISASYNSKKDNTTQLSYLYALLDERPMPIYDAKSLDTEDDSFYDFDE